MQLPRHRSDGPSIRKTIKQKDAMPFATNSVISRATCGWFREYDLYMVANDALFSIPIKRATTIITVHTLQLKSRTFFIVT